MNTEQGQQEKNSECKTSMGDLVDEGLGALNDHMGTRGAHGPEPHLPPTKPHERHMNSDAPPSANDRVVTSCDATTYEQGSNMRYLLVRKSPW